MRMSLLGLSICATLLAACSNPAAPTLSRVCQSWQTASQPVENNKLTYVSFDNTNCSFSALGKDIVLPEGNWRVASELVWKPNASGKRGSCIFLGTEKLTQDGREAMTGNVGTIMNLSADLYSDGRTPIHVSGTQTSGSALGTMALSNGLPQTLVTFTHL